VSTEFDVPAELDDLCAQPHFLQHIRQYNMAMAMASVGHDARVLAGGPSTVILSGRAFHLSKESDVRTQELNMS